MQRMPRLLALGLSTLDAGIALAQATVTNNAAPCGISRMETVPSPAYPPLARAAHVQGTVIEMVRFGLDGVVLSSRVVSGPEMLRASATTAISQWKANPYTGPRECPIVIRFELSDPDQPMPLGDIQHHTVRAYVIVLSDPAGTICSRFLFFQHCHNE